MAAQLSSSQSAKCSPVKSPGSSPRSNDASSDVNVPQSAHGSRFCWRPSPAGKISAPSGADDGTFPAFRDGEDAVEALAIGTAPRRPRQTGVHAELAVAVLVHRRRQHAEIDVDGHDRLPPVDVPEAAARRIQERCLRPALAGVGTGEHGTVAGAAEGAERRSRVAGRAARERRGQRRVIAGEGQRPRQGARWALRHRWASLIRRTTRNTTIGMLRPLRKGSGVDLAEDRGTPGWGRKVQGSPGRSVKRSSERARPRRSPSSCIVAPQRPSPQLQERHLRAPRVGVDCDDGGHAPRGLLRQQRHPGG